MRPAFDGSDNPGIEFTETFENVQARETSLYHLTGHGVSLRFVGRAVDGHYHIVCMTGRGLLHGASAIIEKVKAQGFTAITFHTYRPGMRRILNRVGFREVETVRTGTITETRHILDLNGGTDG